MYESTSEGHPLLLSRGEFQAAMMGTRSQPDTF